MFVIEHAHRGVYCGGPRIDSKTARKIPAFSWQFANTHAMQFDTRTEAEDFIRDKGLRKCKAKEVA